MKEEEGRNEEKDGKKRDDVVVTRVEGKLISIFVCIFIKKNSKRFPHDFFIFHLVPCQPSCPPCPCRYTVIFAPVLLLLSSTFRLIHYASLLIQHSLISPTLLPATPLTHVPGTSSSIGLELQSGTPEFVG